ncbi:MAG: ABC transporter ATP-binding protein, partial [Clostridia bacterium]|nr:ABC transporter ATP-binding protein [Clostridia bacterium]
MGVCTYLASIIEVKNLTKKYRVGSEIISALNGVDLKIESGEFLAIVGTSGSGKSTLLHMMSGLERPTKGEILINGVLINKVREKDMASFRRKHMGFIFQHYNLLTALTALENAALPLVLQGVNVRERNKRAVEILKTLGLGDRMKNKPNQMSGGQQQRVSIARALINNPKILFADEPTGNLDTRTTREIMELLTTMVKEKGQTLVMVTHDMEVANYADRIIQMVDGEIICEEIRGGE